MSLRLRFLVLVAVLAMASAAVAGNIDQTIKSGTAFPIPVSGPNMVGSSAAACAVAYSDLMPTGGTFLPLDGASPGATVPYIEYADDLHLTTAGVLCEFAFTYFNPTAATVDFVITLYGNDAADAVFGAPVAGPFLIAGLPAGLTTVTVPIPAGPFIPADIWFGITTPAGASPSGLVISGLAPSIGVSHDFFLDVPDLGLVFFGGPPTLANFNIEVSVDATVPTEERTWGGIKSLFENE